ncbi:MAG: DNA polymerase III subunit beta, partial [Thomasclavelia spiroformis]
MNFKIKRIKLLNALSKTTKAVSIRSPLPVLTGIKFDLHDDCLILTGSDSDITIQTKIIKDEDLTIYETGGVVLNSRYILDIVRKIDSEYINIQILDGALTRISSPTSKFDLNGTDILDYPRIDLSKNGIKIDINSLVLKNIISQTKFAASDKEHKPILTGINFKATNNQLECTATDSYRLAKKVVSLNEDVTFNITIPQKSLDEISKIIEKDEIIEMYVSDRKVLYVFDNNI